MELSKVEFEILLQLVNGRNRVSDIASALDKTESQIYRHVKKLSKKDLVELSKKQILPLEKIYLNILLQVLSRFPNIMGVLSGCGILLFTEIIEPKTISEIISNTGIKRSTIFKKFKEARKINFLKYSENKYSLNSEIWPDVKEFLVELKKYNEVIDSRVPSGSVIYYKNNSEIVFSSKIKQDALLTAFSAYGFYGIDVLSSKNIYYLPKKKLSLDEIFLHSLYCAEKEDKIQNYILVALFYIKYRKKLLNVKHSIITKINKVLDGEFVKNFPSLSEIKERANMYDIRI